LLRFIVGVFFVLHGLVHLLYSGQSRRFFELQPGMVWPDGAWAFSKLVGDDANRSLASIAYALVAIGFAAGGVGLFLRQAWWRPMATASAAFSAVFIFLFWDGKTEKLADKGGIGLIINIVIIVLLVVLRWPDFGF
jgi:hypothetical protein